MIQFSRRCAKCCQNRLKLLKFHGLRLCTGASRQSCKVLSFLQDLCTHGSQVTSRVECLQVSTEKEIEVQDMLGRLVDALLFSLFQTQMFGQCHQINFCLLLSDF